MSKLTADYYLQQNVVEVAKDLIGKLLLTKIDNKLTAGIITETEAYAGTGDKASHAYNGRFTQRNKVMYEKGGLAYIYLCYGMHHLFNVVTNKKSVPDAVLIRAVKAVEGLDIISFRRSMNSENKQCCNGPGKVSQALGITTQLNGISLLKDIIWIEDQKSDIDISKISATPRIGIDYAEEDALLPYRFVIQL